MINAPPGSRRTARGGTRPRDTDAACSPKIAGTSGSPTSRSIRTSTDDPGCRHDDGVGRHSITRSDGSRSTPWSSIASRAAS